MYKHNLEIEIDLITIITTNRKNGMPRYRDMPSLI